MPDKPILFSGPMVRAIFYDLKTQTRRVLKPKGDAFEAPRFRRGDRLWVRETFGYCPECGCVNHKELINLPRNCRACDAFVDTFKPSIHMPRAYSRLTLTVTEVRVQWLQDISRGDAMSEGCPHANMADGANPRDWFRTLWDGLNAERGYGWDVNPHVAAYTFTVARENIDAAKAA
ncbi:hypothetical protein [Sagittula sp. S175]|uniref:hypothetical protein n=1 Tax=Sagittula sp. S175 TaxID=3415129 RepID=UPI003C7EA4D0